MKFIC